MKIKINYELMSKISEANSGFSIVKTAKHILKSSSISSGVAILLGATIPLPLEATLSNISFFLLLYTVSNVSCDLILHIENKKSAIKCLKLLSQKLRSINVNTNYELLLESYKCQTDYNFQTNESLIPSLEQKKYIMIPVLENGEKKELSIVQEHIIGTSEYSLSIGSPKKILRLVPQPA